MKLKCIFCVILSAIFATLAFADAKHTTDSLEMIKSRVEKKDAVLIDVREKTEWNSGHLSDATLLPLSELKSLPSTTSLELPKNKTLYLHCRSGKRSLVAADNLVARGYTDVRPLAQGFDELVSFGFPAKE